MEDSSSHWVRHGDVFRGWCVSQPQDLYHRPGVSSIVWKILTKVGKPNGRVDGYLYITNWAVLSTLHKYELTIQSLKSSIYSRLTLPLTP